MHQIVCKSETQVKKVWLPSPLVNQTITNYKTAYTVNYELSKCQSLLNLIAGHMRCLRQNVWCPQVPGVAENRPSVLRGDHLLVIKSKERHLEPVTKHKGYVHRVECEEVKLGFGK